MGMVGMGVVKVGVVVSVGGKHAVCRVQTLIAVSVAGGLGDARVVGVVNGAI